MGARHSRSRVDAPAHARQDAGVTDAATRRAPSAQELVTQLGLEPHPEGGYFRETYRDALALSALPQRFSGPRSASTAIYYLLERGDMSALHRIHSDEVWHHYLGATLTVHVLHPASEHAPARYEALRLGKDLAAGERPQAVVPAGSWFGARLEPTEGRATNARDADRAYGDADTDFVLVGCTVAPGFDFRDFELAQRDALLAQFPEHQALVRAMTRAH
ncbi:MAG: cupin domain-containing protein [Sandaracinaceae bacterium]|nr:cupin domain-containing protein [Sandaracinaceae bacterium]